MSGDTVVAAAAPGWGALRRGALLVDQAIGFVCEIIGALLVAAEVTILFAGVVSRYVLDSPLFWTDELANFLFLWLSMLGMVVALRRDGHMRLTTVARWVPPHVASWFAAVASLVVIVFVLEVLLPAAQYSDQQRYVELISLRSLTAIASSPFWSALRWRRPSRCCACWKPPHCAASASHC